MRSLKTKLPRKTSSSASKKRKVSVSSYISFFIGHFRALAWVIGSIFLLGSPALLWWSGLPQEVYQKTSSKLLYKMTDVGFKVESVSLEGRQNTSLYHLSRAIGLELGDSIFFRSPDQIRNDLEELPWVHLACVQRILPNSYLIKIQERKPVALWQHQKVHYLVDEEGIIICRHQHPQYQDLPVIVGQDAPLQASKILHALTKFPDIRKKVTAFVLIGGRRWDLHLNRSSVIKLPEENISDALGRLGILLQQNKVDDEVLEVDLRQNDKIIFRLSPLGLAKLKGGEVEKEA